MTEITSNINDWEYFIHICLHADIEYFNITLEQYKVVYSNKTSYDITKDDFELWQCSGHPFVSKFYFELPRPKCF